MNLVEFIQKAINYEELATKVVEFSEGVKIEGIEIKPEELVIGLVVEAFQDQLEVEVAIIQARGPVQTGSSTNT